MDDGRSSPARRERVGPSGDWRPPVLRAAHGDRSHNVNAYAARAESLIQRYLGTTATPPQLNSNDPNAYFGLLSAIANKNGQPAYLGSEEFLSAANIHIPQPNGLSLAKSEFIDGLIVSVNEYRKIALQLRGRSSAAGAGRAAARSTTRVVKRTRLRRGQRRVKIRIRLTRKAGTRPRRGGRQARPLSPLRVIVSIRAKPRPVVRFVDIPVRISRKSAKKR